ncbi:MAG TPA: AsnC family transcriptional regulator [Acidimicrobiaceae bacterium]|nr:AsnC family transcriptional regulator [Acidimicrobiaceae bacterium]
MQNDEYRWVTKPTLDAIDKLLIRELQIDGRKPYTQLAKVAGLSEAAIRQRVQRLIDGQVMQVVAVTDPLSLGLRRAAMIGIRVEGDLRTAARKLAEYEEVVYVVLTAGTVDILAEVVVEDDEALLELLNDRIRTIPGVVGTETSMYLSIEKQTYQWGAK